jgi:hypothetical protein
MVQLKYNIKDGVLSGEWHEVDGLRFASEADELKYIKWLKGDL